MPTAFIENFTFSPTVLRSQRRLLSAVAFAVVVGVCGASSGCALTAPPADSAEETDTSWDALSSKQTLLSAKQSAALQKNLQSAITATEAAIESLKGQIVVAEAANQAALTEADSLLSQVQQRQSELQSTRTTATVGGIAAGIFGFLVGGPVGAALGVGAVGAGAVAIDADAKLSSLRLQLSAAQARQQKAQSDVTEYYARKAGLEKHLDDLKTRETSIRGILAESTKAGPTSAMFAAWPTVPKRARKLELSRQLLSNLKDQEAVLEDILVLAQALSPELKALVTDLTALRDQADAMVRSTQDDLWKIVAVLASEDPLAAATLWLEGAVAARAKEALAELNIPAVDYALWLVNVWDKGRSFAANPTAALQQELVTKITTSIGAAGSADWAGIARNPVVKEFVQTVGN